MVSPPRWTREAPVPGEGTFAAVVVGLVEVGTHGGRDLTEAALVLMAAPFAGYFAA